MPDVQADLGIIGGSGFYDLQDLDEVTELDVDTPFGRPSDKICIGRVGAVRVAFLSRHGRGHTLAPHEVPHRANIWALTALGVRQVIAVSAVGSLREEIPPLALVVPDQMIDRTLRGPQTFFERGIVGHIAFDSPFCPSLGSCLSGTVEAGAMAGRRQGTLVVIEGPAFSTRAESELYRAWGGDLIGMTSAAEARLAREAGICYAVLACVTDYDTWHPTSETVSVGLVLGNLRQNARNARKVVVQTASRLPDWRDCTCRWAVKDAIVTDMALVPPDRQRDLGPVLSRYREAMAGQHAADTGRERETDRNGASASG